MYDAIKRLSRRPIPKRFIFAGVVYTSPPPRDVVVRVGSSVLLAVHLHRTFVLLMLAATSTEASSMLSGTATLTCILPYCGSFCFGTVWNCEAPFITPRPAGTEQRACGSRSSVLTLQRRGACIVDMY